MLTCAHVSTEASRNPILRILPFDLRLAHKHCWRWRHFLGLTVGIVCSETWCHAGFFLLVSINILLYTSSDSCMYVCVCASYALKQNAMAGFCSAYLTSMLCCFHLQTVLKRMIRTLHRSSVTCVYSLLTGQIFVGRCGILTYVIDRKWLYAALWCLFAAFFSLFGIIHMATAGMQNNIIRSYRHQALKWHAYMCIECWNSSHELHPLCKISVCAVELNPTSPIWLCQPTHTTHLLHVRILVQKISCSHNTAQHKLHQCMPSTPHCPIRMRTVLTPKCCAGTDGLSQRLGVRGPFVPGKGNQECVYTPVAGIEWPNDPLHCGALQVWESGQEATISYRANNSEYYVKQFVLGTD